MVLADLLEVADDELDDFGEVVAAGAVAGEFGGMVATQVVVRIEEDESAVVAKVEAEGRIDRGRGLLACNRRTVKRGGRCATAPRRESGRCGRRRRTRSPSSEGFGVLRLPDKFAETRVRGAEGSARLAHELHVLRSVYGSHRRDRRVTVEDGSVVGVGGGVVNLAEAAVVLHGGAELLGRLQEAVHALGGGRFFPGLAAAVAVPAFPHASRQESGPVHRSRRKSGAFGSAHGFCKIKNHYLKSWKN